MDCVLARAKHHLIDDREAVGVDGTQADVSRRALVQPDIVQRIRLNRVRVTRQQVCGKKSTHA